MEIVENEVLISKKGVATEMGVSVATINNWVKLGLIDEKSNNLFEKVKITDLKLAIQDGELNKLNNRANKISAERSFIPVEYLNNPQNIQKIESIIYLFKNLKINIESFIWAISVNILQKEELISFEFDDEKIVLKSRKKYLLDFFLLWKKSIETDDFRLIDLFNLSLPNDEADLLGIIYQSLKNEGDKAKNGSYYTPKYITEDIKLVVKPSDKILDPCCGTGQFLINITSDNHEPQKIYGFDIDEIAVNITKINLFIRFKDQEFEPKIYHKNFIFDVEIDSIFTNPEINDFDVIATNPPWGYRFSLKEKETVERSFFEISTTESSSIFLYKSFKILKQKGFLSFLLPESILNVKTHEEIRKFILKNSTIHKIKYLNRPFKNVFSTVIRLDIFKKKPENKSFIVESEKEVLTYNLDNILSRSHYTIQLSNNEKISDILKKCYQKGYQSLAGNAEFALGIVTGNNEKFIKTEQKDGLEPIFKGKDVNKYKLIEAKNFIEFNPSSFQQVAPVEKYREKEKLIYRFISKELVFALDTQQHLTLNSANIVIPTFRYPIKTILALFNSTLYQFFFKHKFNSIKVLKYHIENLPLPTISDELHKKIEILIDEILISDKIQNSIALDEIIFEIFKFEEEEITIIKNNL